MNPDAFWMFVGLIGWIAFLLAFHVLAERGYKRDAERERAASRPAE